ncbi:hypothetical protein Glove_9g220 [Diversispora epigaea]|uniref:Uncharacterized protein n=1 Tax=Diversispora epigaea TaxID=1348612 RepID=A0A397JSU6_9GLOM|nr:hypothetical protein Glove_9g220 [Diversispora epigaea]
MFAAKMFGTKMFIKKLPLTLNLFQWDFMEYNTLPEVEIAHNNLQKQSDFTKFLGDMYTFTKEHSIELGVRLVHRHLQVDEGKIMIEKFQFDHNSPSLITSADYPTDQAYPASWLLKNDGSLLVFEYSTDAHVKRSLEKLNNRPRIFVEFCKLIMEYHLEDLLAPCITARDSLRFFKKVGFLENTCFKHRISIVKSKNDVVIDNEQGPIIATLWAYIVNDSCFGTEGGENRLDCYSCTHCNSCSSCCACCPSKPKTYLVVKK